ncbi:Predicted lipoprotein with conserved Yx(FWY)xxD motif [Actinacidiphila alni]|uniref:Predicted lipoprotein with conserved Yx(FWY)xxD motif n=1 Tax=Actinacidiphila alni TaxID=380248 RepID=A0A1I2J271_9ACTN|nr:SCO0930 family lipoprotein [Actinacidiphila alni]SFF47347.1 Predicted lipoprotein with conserved Yx(FWY)xxD motif [Actinacidiphila alni]
MRQWRYALFAGVAGAMLFVTGCGGNGSDKADDVVKPAAAGVTASPSTTSSAPTGGDPSSAASLTVAKDAKLGSLVIDGLGMTLYRFDKDVPGNGTSNCNDECAKTWPPVLADDPAATSDINPDLLGTVTRADGRKQVTVGKWPLYRYSLDTKPGDVKGQNVGGVWFAAAPDGKKAGAPRPALSVVDNPKLGKILTDGQGKTLYLFTKDTPWPMKTACDATCLKKWTPSGVVTAADAKAAGLDPKVLFTFTTPNGTKQEAYNCWPAYTFNGDTEAGQTNGQNVGGVWFAIKQDITIDRGKTIPAAKGTPGTSAPSKSGSGSDSGSGSGSDKDTLDPDDLTLNSAGSGY